jgi:hypothetical protein
MRIAYCGNFRKPWCTEVHVSASFEALGHEMVRLQEHDHAAEPLAMFEQMVDCDLVLYTKTVGINPTDGLELWRRLETAGVPTVSYHLDLYVGLDREAQLDYEPFWRTSVVFSADGGSQDAMAAHGVDHEWLRAGVYRPECVNGTASPKHQRISVGFVGSHRWYHAEWPYRMQLVRWLRSTYRGRAGIYPQGPAVRGQDLNDLYASVPVFVGDSACLGFTHERYWSDRVYETLGRGGFLIHPRIVGLDDEFVDGEHLRLYTFGDFRELRHLIDHYVRHPDEGREIAAAGQRFVRDNCTYEHRCAEMLGRLVERGILDRATVAAVTV